MIVVQDLEHGQIVLDRGVDVTWVELVTGRLVMDSDFEGTQYGVKSVVQKGDHSMVGRVIELGDLCGKMIVPEISKESFFGDTDSIGPIVRLARPKMVGDADNKGPSRLDRCDKAIQPVYKYKPKDGGAAVVLLDKPVFDTADLGEAKQMLEDKLAELVSELLTTEETVIDRSFPG